MDFIKRLFKKEVKEPLVRDGYGKVEYIDSFGNCSSYKFTDPELDKAMQELSNAIDETYRKSNINEFLRKKYG